MTLTIKTRVGIAWEQVPHQQPVLRVAPYVTAKWTEGRIARLAFFTQERSFSLSDEVVSPGAEKTAQKISSSLLCEGIPRCGFGRNKPLVLQLCWIPKTSHSLGYSRIFPRPPFAG